MKTKTITLILCILCATCITPVMAANKQTNIVEDGVHFIKFDDSPTILDDHFYDIKTNVNFVVDGNQVYWVRIGNTKATTLSSNTVARLMCKYGLYIGAIGAGGVIGATSAGAEAGTIGTGTPIILPLTGIALGFIVGIAGFSDELCIKFEKWFVDNKYQVVASDGTILMGVAKTNTAGIQELKKDGIDIQKLTHLSKDGNTIHDL